MYLFEVLSYWQLAMRRVCVVCYHTEATLSTCICSTLPPHRWYTLVLPLNVLMLFNQCPQMSKCTRTTFFSSILVLFYLSCSVPFQHASLYTPVFARYSERPMPSLSLPRPPRPRPPSLFVYRTTLLSTTTPISTTNKKTSNT
jgi:hypothetical protein